MCCRVRQTCCMYSCFFKKNNKWPARTAPCLLWSVSWVLERPKVSRDMFKHVVVFGHMLLASSHCKRLMQVFFGSISFGENRKSYFHAIVAILTLCWCSFFNSQPNPFQSSPYQIFAFFPTNPLTLRMQSVWKFMILAKTSFAVCCYIWTKTAHSHLEANAHKKNKFTPKATQHTTPIAKRRVSFLWRQFGIDRRASLVKKNRSLNNVGNWLVWGAPPLKVI